MQSIVIQLPEAELLAVEGPDTHRFLQGQLTCDTGQVTARQAAPGAYCNVKGRALADFLALCHGDEDRLYLRTGPGMAEVLAGALAKFIVFFKAETRLASDEWRAFGVWGEDAAQLVGEAFGGAPERDWQSLATDHAMLVRLPGSRPRFECWLHKDAAVPAALDGASQPATDLWRLEDIRCGRAHITPGTSGQYTPQLLNYDINGSVNFHKGCYTGQEVVARMYYRGSAKKRLYRTRAGVSGITEHMAPVRQGEEKPLGEIIDACGDGEGATEMLTVLPCKDADAALEQAGDTSFELWDRDSGQRPVLELLPIQGEA